MTAAGSKKFLKVLSGEIQSPPPVWMMRQAGRHLPEYLEMRARARDFLDFCYTPSLAAEATLQPIRRYGMDGAILFADILLILDAMGLDVKFEKGEGPLVETIEAASDLARVKPQARPTSFRRSTKRSPGESRTSGGDRSDRVRRVTWTVTLYAVEGRGKTDKVGCLALGPRQA
jgi:uroporphyrinogen decarboxylase